MKFVSLSTVTSLTLYSLTLTNGQNLCDDSYALNCPEESGWDVGNCLKKTGNLDPVCESFIALHDICKV
jgi:hypothetical protein